MRTLTKIGLVVGAVLLVASLAFLSAPSEHQLALQQSVHEKPRSPEWPKVEKAHREHEPACQVCGWTGKGLNVHHIVSFRIRPDLELDDANLITLCGSEGRCKAHYWLGHCGEWKGWNPDVRKDAELMRQRWQRSKELAKEESK